MNRIFPVLISGFIVAVLSVVPVIKTFSCCLLMPFAAVFSLYLDIKFNKNIERIRVSKAIQFGLLTGLFATFFYVPIDLLITFLTRSNDLIEAIPQAEIIINELNLNAYSKESLIIMRKMADEIRITGFSFFYALMLSFSNIITNIIFGTIGGLLGMVLLNKRIMDYTE